MMSRSILYVIKHSLHDFLRSINSKTWHHNHCQISQSYSALARGSKQKSGNDFEAILYIS